MEQLTKEGFLKTIQDGKWFLITKGYNSFLVKFKPVTIKDLDTFVETLWLSNSSWESMCFSEMDSSSWDIINGQFVIYSASNYHFGSTDGPDEESIYNENGYLDVLKMKKAILDYAKKDFISESELNEIWNKIEQNNLSDFEILKFK